MARDSYTGISGSAAIGPRDTPASWRVETADLHLPQKSNPARFGSSEQAEFPHGKRRTADSLVATLATRAGLLVIAERDQQITLDRIRSFLAGRPETSRGEFTLPMLTGVLRTRRLSRPSIAQSHGRIPFWHSRTFARGADSRF